MGFLSSIAPILGVAAAPFTGGASLAGTILSGVGSVASGIGKSAADSRQQGVDYALLRDKLGLDESGQHETQQINRADLDMRQRAADQAARQQAFTNAMRSSMIQNWKSPTLPSGVPRISLGGEGFGALGGQAADELGRQAMIKLVSGEKFDPLPALERYKLSSPEKMPGASTTEKIMDIIGLGGTAVGGIMNRNQQQNNLTNWLSALGGGFGNG